MRNRPPNFSKPPQILIAARDGRNLEFQDFRFLIGTNWAESLLAVSRTLYSTETVEYCLRNQVLGRMTVVRSKSAVYSNRNSKLSDGRTESSESRRNLGILWTIGPVIAVRSVVFGTRDPFCFRIPLSRIRIQVPPCVARSCD
jgi:hypothetical protein